MMRSSATSTSITRNGRKIEIRPISAALGAEIVCGDLRKLDDEAAKVLYQAYLDHLVLLFRGQTLDDDALLELGRRFGELESGSARPVGVKALDRPEIVVVSNVVEKGVPIGSLGYGEAVWHSDMSFNEIPTAASLLTSLEVPPVGGNTGFSNMYLALETLPEHRRQRIANLTIKNDASRTSAGELRPGFPEVVDIPTCPGPSHPIVRTHAETGHNCLYLGRRPNAYVNGVPLEESEILLEQLWSHATRPELTWHHQWLVGDLLVWDNRCTLHHRDPFDSNHRRVLHKTQTKGERPYYSPFASTLPHSRGHLVSV